MNIAEQEFPFPAEHASNVFGQFDANMKKIEKTLHVTIIFRDDKLKLIGGEKDCDRAKHVIEQLLLLSQRGNDITEQNINYTLSLSMTNEESAVTQLDSDVICHTIMGKPIKPKTMGQKKYVDMITDKMIVFGVGPAGTGKTYLAMAKAITAFKANEVKPGRSWDFFRVTFKVKWIRTYGLFTMRFTKLWVRILLLKTWKRD